MSGYCDSYCEHGGECELDRGHDGLHDSRYCQWDDAGAVSQQESDDAFRSKSPLLAAFILPMENALKDMIGDDD